jgi:hypothetical protein
MRCHDRRVLVQFLDGLGCQPNLLGSLVIQAIVAVMEFHVPYHPGYYAAYVLDPDGNNLEAVHHGPTRRSAPSVIIAPAG